MLMMRLLILTTFMVCNLMVMAQRGLHIEPLFEGKVIPQVWPDFLP